MSETRTIQVVMPAIILYPKKDMNGNLCWSVVTKEKTVAAVVDSLEKGLALAKQELGI